MAEKFGKMKYKTISFGIIKVNFNNTFHFTSFEKQYSGQNTIQQNENMTYQKKWYRIQIGKSIGYI
jgi:hypothetical protein